MFSADYTHVPEVGIVVRNFTEAPATEISFEFSAPLEHPDGRVVLSDLRFLREGLPFLEPEGEVRCPWGSLPDLLPMLKHKGLEDGIRVTTRYKDLADGSYETAFTVNPLLFEDAGLMGSRGMEDLVEAVEKILGPSGGRRPTDRRGTGPRGRPRTAASPGLDTPGLYVYKSPYRQRRERVRSGSAEGASRGWWEPGAASGPKILPEPPVPKRRAGRSLSFRPRR